MKKLAAALILLCGCSSTPAITEVPVSKSQWMLCWERCGKKDMLVAVTPTVCVCKGGYRIQSSPLEAQAPKTEAVGETKNIWEMMGF